MRQVVPYVLAVLLVGAASGIGVLVSDQVAPVNLAMLYLLAVVISGLRWGSGSAVLSSVLSAVAFDFFMVPPRFSFFIADTEHVITFSVLLSVALVIGTLTSRLRDHAAAIRRRQEETAALYAFSRQMVAAHNVTETAVAVINHIAGSFGRPVSLQLRGEGRPELHAADFGSPLSEREQRAARWTLEHGQPSGWGEGPMPDIQAECLPLKTVHAVVGVVVVQHPDDDEPLSPDERRLLEAFATQAAVVLEREMLVETARRAHLLMEADKLHDALLHSISHGLKTPLASIIGSLSAVLDPSPTQLDLSTRQELLETAREEAERLNWLVSNLLDMTRLESGHLKLTIDWYDLEDVVGVALGQTADRLKPRAIHVHMPEDLPLVPLDEVLVVQVLNNLLDNAAKYSPPGSPIDIWVRQDAEAVAVTVADRGPGIPDGERERVFEKFFRLERPGSPPGTGLGLAICKGIVEAHRGRIWVGARDGGGTEISFSLPLTRDLEARGSA
jgi:two-component system sensor histidine kinase KdpD